MTEEVINGREVSDTLFSRVCKLHPDRKNKYSLTLTKSQVCFSQIAATKKNTVTLNTADITGSQITTQGDQKQLNEIDELSSCVTIYAYERKNSKSKVVTGRKRHVVTVLFDSKAVYSENNEDAVTFKERLLEVSCSSGAKVWKGKKILVLVNPKSGPGKALPMFQQRVAPMLAEAGAQFSLVVTQRAGHAFDMMKDLDLSKWYGIVIVSGDGLIYEVVNGLKLRTDSELALKIPIGCLPGGSGNALCAAICYHAGESALDNVVTNATYVLLKHQVVPMDFVELETQSGKQITSFLSVTWGLMADIDIESEKYRFMGEARMTLGTLIRLVNLRKYRGRLSFLPVEPYLPPTTKNKFQRSASQYPITTSRDEEQTVRLKKATSIVSEPHAENGDRVGGTNGSQSVEITAAENGNPVGAPNGDQSVDFTVAAENGQAAEEDIRTSGGDGNARETVDLPPLCEPVPSDWVTTEREFVTVGVIYQTHLATDLIVRKDRSFTEGTMDLVIINHTVTRAKILKAFLDMSEGKVEPSADVELVRVSAFRLEPLTEKGVIAVDGEVVDYGAIQGKMAHSMGRVMARQ